MKKNILIYILLLMFFTSLFAQDYESDSLDDLFAEPDEDIIVIEENTEDVRSLVESTELFSVNGTFGGTAGLGVGMLNTEMGFTDNNVDFILGAAADSSVSFTVRPDKTVMLKTTLEASIDDQNIANPWSDIGVSELYVEYDLLDTALISFGKMKTTVGNDFIDKEEGTSFLVTLPTVLSGLNFYANADSTTIESGQFDYKKLFAGTWVDFVAGTTRFTTGFRYKELDDAQFEERFGTLFGMQTNIFNCNIISEVQYFAYPEHYLFGNIGAYFIEDKIMAGLQYDVEGYVTGYEHFEHAIELGFRYASIFNTALNFDIVSKFQIDNVSGFVIPAISMNPFKYVRIAFALPYIFGDAGFDVYDNFLDGEYSVNLPTELSMLVSVSVEIPF